jgi:hypothetical protein
LDIVSFDEETAKGTAQVHLAILVADSGTSVKRAGIPGTPKQIEGKKDGS